MSVTNGGVFVGKLLRITPIDDETGEQGESKYQKYTEKWDESKGYKIPYNKLGCKIFTCLDYPRGLTDSDIGKFHRLQKHCMRETHLIGYRSNGMIRAMTPQEMYKKIGISERRGREWLVNMIKFGMIAKNTVKWKNIERVEYYTNPAYGFNGLWLSASLFVMFQESLKQVLAPWEVNKFLRLAMELNQK